MVHRWAAANISGGDPDAVPNQSTIRETVEDIETYYAEGLVGLVAALRGAPEDLKAMTFLNDAPAPRQFWARRQAHETAMHGVDAQAAALGRLPTAAETSITPAFAEDGLDELLRGFFTRGKSKLFEGNEYTVLVAPDDSERRWLLHIAERMTVASGDATDDADATLSGSPIELYLALWNRGDAVRATGRPEVLAAWRRTQRVTWS